MEKQIKEILSVIDKSINEFQGDIPAIQKLIMDELIPVVKEFQIRNGRLINNLQNLKLLGTLRNKLKKVIVNARYKQNVENFLNSFDQVGLLQQQYFSQFNKKYKPSNTLPIIKEQAIEQTINDLVGQGMNAIVISSVEEILRQNITTGGFYLDLQRELENHILDNYTGPGSLSKYTKQITVDAINQYNAQYHETIAQDLKFNWGRYIGSLLTTSREFCIHMTDKDYFHKDELPEIIKGNIDGHHLKLGKTTGIPLGMIPGTTPENFKVRRGGYLCGHQVFWIPDSAVPKNIRENHSKVIPPVKEPVVPDGQTAIAKATFDNNKNELDEIRNAGFKINEETFNHLGKEIIVKYSLVKGSYFNPDTNTVVIGFNELRITQPNWTNRLVDHEIGHAIHHTRGIIKLATKRTIRKDFETHFDELKDIIKGKEREIDDLITKTKEAQGFTYDQHEDMGIINDILGSLSAGEFGGGHNYDYYKRAGNSEAEIFAHGVSLLKSDNEFSTITPEMEKVILKMIEYTKKVFAEKL